MTTPYAKPIEIKNNKRALTDEQKKKHKADLKKLYEEEKQMVRGRFICFEPQGGSVSFVYRKYEWEHPTQYTFMDGETYEIPLGVARHLNGIDVTAKALEGVTNTCSYPIHAFKMDAKSNVPSIDVGKRQRRFSFQTLTGEAVG